MSTDLLGLFDNGVETLLPMAAEQTDLSQDALSRLDKTGLVFAIVKAQSNQDGSLYGVGVLETHPEGFGFLRAASANFLPGPDDIYVSQSQIRRFLLRTGDTIIGIVRPPKEGERYTALLRVESVNGTDPSVESPTFDNLTAIHPDDAIDIGSDPTLAVIQAVAPLGLGHRGLIVAPRKTGRVAILQKLTNTLLREDDLHVTVLLTAAPAEEIQDWRTATHAEVIATPLDEPQGRHLAAADIVFQRGRRQAENGENTVIIVDSLSRLARACLAEITHTGRDISGIDAAALLRIRQYMGSARALEEGGSLTIITAFHGDTQSPLDTALLAEINESANWRVEFTQAHADRGVIPPIHIGRSGTQREDLLLTDTQKKERDNWRSKLTDDSLKNHKLLLAAAAR
jgi:transcription termination factor Rho